MINNLIFAPIFLFLIVYSTLLIFLVYKNLLKDKILSYFIAFLFIIWVFSFIQIAEYFNILPSLISDNLLSILVLLVNIFLLFEYLFVGKYLLRSNNKIVYRIFMFAFFSWSFIFALPSIGLRVVESSNIFLQIIFVIISFLPSVYYFFKFLSRVFAKKWKYSKKISLISIFSLLVPILVVFYLIYLQPASILVAINIIFLSLSASLYFYAYVLYLDQDIKIFKTLKEKIILIVSLLVMIPITLRTTYIYYNSQSILEENVSKNLEDNVGHVTSEINFIINNYRRDIILLSHYDDFNTIGLDDESRGEIERLLLGYINNTVFITSISVYDTNGFQILSANKDLGYPVLKQNLSPDSIKDDEVFSSLLNKNIDDIYISSFSDFEKIDEVPKLKISTLAYEGLNSTNLIVIEFDIQKLFNNYLENTNEISEFILDENGNYIFHQDFEKVLLKENIENDDFDVWEKIKSNAQNTLRYDKEEQSYVYSYKKIVIPYLNQERVLYLVHLQKASDLFADVNTLTNNIILSSLVVSIITFVIVFFSVNNLIMPLSALKNAITNFNGGNRDIFKRKSSTEIEEIGDSFLSLLDRLDTSQVQIENKVKAQTQEISQNAINLEKQRTAMINLIEDIDTQRKLTLQQALDLKKFKLAIDSVSEIILIANREGNVLYVNPIVKTITGFTQKEVIGTKAGSLWGKQMSKKWYEDFWNTISVKKQRFEGNINNKRKNGEEFIAHMTVNPLLDDVGNVQYYISVQRDVTKEVKVDRMKTDFISLASHQLRTPLSGMKWFLEMLLDNDFGKLNIQQNDVVKKISESNTRMITLVNSLLNTSRIESGRIMVNPVKVNVVSVIKDIILSLQKDYKNKNINLIYKADSSLHEVVTDINLFTQVVINLLTNSIKYTKQNGHIKVLVGKKDNDLFVQIIDDGVGIPKSEQKSVFSRFFRATNIVKIQADGNGLGLYMAKIIIQTLRGKIGFKSEVNVGSTFWFTIPLKGIKKKEGEVSLTVSKDS